MAPNCCNRDPVSLFGGPVFIYWLFFKVCWELFCMSGGRGRARRRAGGRVGGRVGAWAGGRARGR